MDEQSAGASRAAANETSEDRQKMTAIGQLRHEAIVDGLRPLRRLLSAVSCCRASSFNNNSMSREQLTLPVFCWRDTADH